MKHLDASPVPNSPDKSNQSVSSAAESVGQTLAAVRRALRIQRNDAELASAEAFQFFRFAWPRLHESNAQLFQDLWALWETKNKRNGYFVEFGATDGVFLSNTYLLEKTMAWGGVVAEANPVFIPSLHKNRSCHVSDKCVFSSSHASIAFLPTARPEFSRIASIVPDDGHEQRGERLATEVCVQTISLNDLLIEARAPVDIDYMSVDTEGSELEILSAFDFDRWNVRLISVEHNHTSLREALNELLTARGYVRKWPELSAFEDWYVHSGPRMERSHLGHNRW